MAKCPNCKSQRAIVLLRTDCFLYHKTQRLSNDDRRKVLNLWAQYASSCSGEDRIRYRRAIDRIYQERGL